MEQQKPKIRFVLRRSSLLVKIIVLSMVVVCLAALIWFWVAADNFSNKAAAEQTAGDQTAQENQQWQEKIDDLDTDQGLDQVAQDEFDMVPEDSIIIETTH